MTRTLVKHAHVVSMDPAIGDIDDGDILIEGDKIVEVGRNIEAADAEVVDARGHIVTPGLVNAHIHTWEFPLRGIGANWVSSRDYHGNMHRKLAIHYAAPDVYAANLLGALNQLNYGASERARPITRCAAAHDARRQLRLRTGPARASARAVRSLTGDQNGM